MASAHKASRAEEGGNDHNENVVQCLPSELVRRYLSLMLEIAISLIVGFALGYGVREWVFRRYRRAEQRRRRPF